jgi:membrane-bound serine protease (ClpP class)
MTHSVKYRSVFALFASAMLMPLQGIAQNDGATTETVTQVAAESQEAKATAGDEVFVIPIRGEIETGLYLILVRAMREAKEHGAKAIVLDMHTPGGRVDSAMKIRDLLVTSEVPTYTFVNNMAISAGAFIAIATDTIVMAPGSNIGGALPITVGPEGAQGADEKFISVFASEMRKTAKAKGHPADIAEGFSNPNIEIPGVKEKGTILTLDYDQATSVGLAAYIAPSIEAMIEKEGMGEARVVRFQPTRTDAVARFLSSPAILGLLMLVGIGGIFLEIKTPGFGIPGFVGIGALATYFFGSYLANLSGFIEVIFFAIGVLLLLVEIFVIPGFGVAGILGILLMAGSMFFAMFNLAPSGFDFNVERVRVPIYTMFFTMIAAVPLIFVAARLIARTSIYDVLRLAPPPAKKVGVQPAGPALAAGQVGIALTDLRPSGVATLGDERVDVLTRGEYIQHGAHVEIIEVVGNRVFVKEARRTNEG